MGHIGREGEPVTGSLPSETPSMWQHYKGGQDLLTVWCQREEEQGGQGSQQLGKTSQSRAAARAQDMSTGGRLVGSISAHV